MHPLSKMYIYIYSFVPNFIIQGYKIIPYNMVQNNVTIETQKCQCLVPGDCSLGFYSVKKQFSWPH